MTDVWSSESRWPTGSEGVEPRAGQRDVQATGWASHAVGDYLASLDRSAFYGRQGVGSGRSAFEGVDKFLTKHCTVARFVLTVSASYVITLGVGKYLHWW